MNPVALVTGASAGIGAELARVFARNGHSVVLVARREDRLRALASEFVSAGWPAPVPLPVDLGASDAVARIEKGLAARDLEPEFVVNNAGFGLIGAAAELDAAEQLDMIGVNVEALTALSLAFLPGLIGRGGGLLNVASVAGFVPGPGSAVYYASKAYVLSFTEALHHELRPKGVRVTALCPGPVATEFQVRAGLRHNRTPWPLGVPAVRVAEQGYAGLMRGQRIVVPGIFNKAVTLLPRLLPRGMVAGMVARRQRSRQDDRSGGDPAPPA